MALLNWLVVVLATSAAIAARENSLELSITVRTYVVLLAGGCLLALIIYRRHTSLGQTSKITVQVHARQLNTSIYELYSPPGTPSMDVLFFHGFQLGDYENAHLSTWKSGDGSCVWPQTWLVEEFPDARILSISYNASLLKSSQHAKFDMYTIVENLTSDFLGAKIGQKPYCPIILVGHSFGGLVIKQLCVYISSEIGNSKSDSNRSSKLKNFLENVKGIFFYATPHQGVPFAKMATRFLAKSPLLEYVTTLSTPAARLNFHFDNMYDRYRKSWRIEGLGESLPIKWGRFHGLVVVPESTSRYGENFNIAENTDHISICRPMNRVSRSFGALTRFLGSIANDSKEEMKIREDIQKYQESRAREKARNWQHLPKQVMGIEFQFEVKRKLENSKMVGLVGMGGVGKTTLAKAVFNDLSSIFEYSCFVPDVKAITGTSDTLTRKMWKRLHYSGNKVGEDEDWPKLSGKRLLLVLDDISDDRDVQVLSDIAGRSSPESYFIVTSRDRQVLKSLPDVYDVPFLNSNDSNKLFISQAFPDQVTVPTQLTIVVFAIVEKCHGLPLALEVVGKYLKMKDNYDFWKQTLLALDNAEAITDLNKSLWEKLRLSYNGLQEKEQQMFLDVATFFSNREHDEYNWTLREAKAAWKEVYETDCESLLWQTLVDRSLVYDVEEGESIRVHDQLRSLGRMIASESGNSGQCRVWEKTMALKLLQNTNESSIKEIQALQLLIHSDHFQDSEENIHTTSRALHKLKNLRYLEVDAPLLVDGAQEYELFPCNLVLLGCVDLKSFDPVVRNHLVVLRLSCRLEDSLSTSIGNFPTLKILRLRDGWSISRVPDEIGFLSQLEHLEFSDFYRLQKPPETLGRISTLKHLRFMDCPALCTLPQSFGQLSSLQHLVFSNCGELRALPESFGHLPRLKHLEFRYCSQLATLHESFGHLSALEWLELHMCNKLETLPESLGHLPRLKHLEFSFCTQLATLPESFGHLSALEWLELHVCDISLPESFGHLPRLKHLEFRFCSQLAALPESFGHLSALEWLELRACDKLETLPDSFGHLPRLEHLECHDSELATLPESFGHLSSLQHIVFSGCYRLHALPETFGELGALVNLKFSGCHMLKALPNSFSNLSRLSRLELVDCDNLHSLIPYRQLSKLQYLEISETEKLPDSLAELTALRHLIVDCVFVKSIPDFIKTIGSLQTLELARLPHVEELPPWLGETGVAPLGLSRKFFRVRDGCFCFTGETMTSSKVLIQLLDERAVEKVKTSDYVGALAILCPSNLGVLKPSEQGLLLLERGIVKRMMEDLHGSLEDLTAALEVLSKGDVEQLFTYTCRKQRGLVNFLLEDLDGAENDGAMALKLWPSARKKYQDRINGGIHPRLGDKSVQYMHFRLFGWVEHFEEEAKMREARDSVMEKVEASDFLGALEVWDTFNARVSGYHNQSYFLQERGVLKRFIGDLHGALEDLTAALEIDNNNYECHKHRAYVKHLLGDVDGARRDAESYLAVGRRKPKRKFLGGFDVKFLEFDL